MAEDVRAPETLKLVAHDEEDLAVLSAVLQDALIPISEMAYLPEEQRFALVANRFRWEAPPDRPRDNFERRLTGFSVGGVTAVKRRGFSLAEPDRILALLAIRQIGDALQLDFAGGAAIRLETGEILCHLDDLGEPWPTRWQPRHPLDEAGR
ncbi:MAG TPA: DUF2948 family protein [Stellaceae bacterium]|nr:DUF2948 family protein [Stellaceae bacterium]